MQPRARALGPRNEAPNARLIPGFIRAGVQPSEQPVIYSSLMPKYLEIVHTRQLIPDRFN